MQPTHLKIVCRSRKLIPLILVCNLYITTTVIAQPGHVQSSSGICLKSVIYNGLNISTANNGYFKLDIGSDTVYGGICRKERSLYKGIAEFIISFPNDTIPEFKMNIISKTDSTHIMGLVIKGRFKDRTTYLLKDIPFLLGSYVVSTNDLFIETGVDSCKNNVYISKAIDWNKPKKN